MSNNKNNPRSLDGAETIEADVINIFEKLEVNGELGNAKQLLRVNEDADAIEWNNLENLTFSGAGGGAIYNGTISRTINIPETLTAALPITISSNEISFNTTSGTNKVAISTIAEKRVLELGNNSTANYIKLQENNGLVACSLINLNGDIKVFSSGNLTFFSDAFGSTPFIQITKSSFLPTDNMPTYAIGNATYPIHTINCRELTSQNTSIFSGGIKQASSGATFSITSLGTGDFTAINISGNVNANGNIVGDGNTDLSGIDDANMVSLTLSGDMNANGNIVGDGNTALSGINTISLKDANSYIDTNGGDLSLDTGDILGCNTLNVANITMSGDITGSNSVLSGINQITMTNNFSNINMNGCSLTNPVISAGGDINMNAYDIDNITDIFFHSVSAGTLNGGSLTNKLVFNNCDFSSATNTQASVSIPTALTNMNSITFSGGAGVKAITGDGGNKVVITNCDLSSLTNTHHIPSTLTDITTNNITLTSNSTNDRTISFTEDTTYTCKYYTDFTIETQYLANTSPATSMEQHRFNSCWFLGNLGEGYYESMVVSPINPTGTGNSGISVIGTGTGSTGGFSTYPHFIFKGTGSVFPGELTISRYFLSKIFPINAYKDVGKITYKAIAGSNTNGGASLSTNSRLYFMWDKGDGLSNLYHRGYNFPPNTSPATTTSNYYILIGDNSMTTNWTDYTIDIDGVNTPSSTNIVLSATQKSHFLNARTCGFVNLNEGGEENIGITNISMLSKGQLNTYNKIQNVGEINDIRLSGNGYLNSSIYGFSYLGLNYCNGWYYEMLDDSRWIGDDDDETPSSMMVREPPNSYAGTTNTYGGIIMKGTHTQIYYNFNVPPGYRLAGYFVGLKKSTGSIDTTTISSSFFNELLMLPKLGADVSPNNTTSKCFVISEATDSDGTPNPITTNISANRSYRGYNREEPVKRDGGTGTTCIVPYTNNFPNLNDAKQFGSYNQLRDTYTYMIMAFKSYPGWTNAYAFSGGYLKYERWDGEND